MRVKGEEYKQPAVCLPFSLGVCYDNGKGVQQDKAEAVQRYRKDAEQADADAQFNLGVCYNQPGYSKNYGSDQSGFGRSIKKR